MSSLAFRRMMFAAILGGGWLVWLALGQQLSGFDPLQAVSSALDGPRGRFWIMFATMWAASGCCALVCGTLGTRAATDGSANRGIS